MKYKNNNFDELIQDKINKVMKQAVTMMLKKLDQFIHVKFSRIEQDHDNYRQKMESKMENVEMKLVRKLYEHKKQFHDLEH